MRLGLVDLLASPLDGFALAFQLGLSLALLETLNDIGASEFLGVNTLTVAVYTTWITRSDLAGAAQIACTMLGFVLLLLWLERHGRRHQRFGSAQRMRPMQPRRLQGVAAWGATAAASLPVLQADNVYVDDTGVTIEYGISSFIGAAVQVVVVVPD